jgi:hypothetical protein
LKVGHLAHFAKKTGAVSSFKRESPLATLDWEGARREAEMRNIENRLRRVLGPNFDAIAVAETLAALENPRCRRAYAAAMP